MKFACVESIQLRVGKSDLSQQLVLFDNDLGIVPLIFFGITLKVSPCPESSNYAKAVLFATSETVLLFASLP